ncbi:hypothetical protein FOQG_09686 [Fusarium oxysporum f. sp. raphani 54005]|uniref:Uncharacterized protein n=1 Tax=Fusarium oxysporum f. sp. raphani 54005 TaxID=1089458 RepID=X0C6H5_FUSOX|nr:hypothetical protein FOQG_09686 [Fusarium oxysporum f. sp. raphani 54005]
MGGDLDRWRHDAVKVNHAYDLECLIRQELVGPEITIHKVEGTLAGIGFAVRGYKMSEENRVCKRRSCLEIERCGMYADLESVVERSP